MKTARAPLAPREPVQWVAAGSGLVIAILSFAGVALLLPISGLCQTVTVRPGAADPSYCAADAPYQMVSSIVVMVLFFVVLQLTVATRVRYPRATAVAFVLLVVAAVGAVAYLALDGVG